MPATLDEMLAEANTTVEAVINFIVPGEVLVERISGRRALGWRPQLPCQVRPAQGGRQGRHDGRAFVQTIPTTAG
ncbi:hypothetical protein PR003_g31792 [Phytophthora rubi]|uniref:Uncharacterized protein n=1 Tax=Phytophthora rubi TaxID=129364 RepID=A0A6A3GP79_9STRA|nr:hypothetical protein PR001_g30685 [Phytophthora rubi]KAE8975630.1 hypothetical protein PR002_g25556 [Phytophthora rubi]KAE9267386.1 hypothetical protein PR003_g31792 [Phytophthora rubi]